jgi:hypothetical protein
VLPVQPRRARCLRFANTDRADGQPRFAFVGVGGARLLEALAARVPV